MTLKNTPELNAFLSTYFPDTQSDEDEKATRDFIAAATPEKRQQVVAQAKRLLEDPAFPLEELGTEANRWFGDADEARGWLREIVKTLEGAQESDTVVVKDSNGTLLSEGDSVQVIKDLKVKGGSSDLKRGTTIKKIHLIDSAEAIECRVDGSTLVLKTCFLKKV
jgi:protein PhnA